MSGPEELSLFDGSELVPPCECGGRFCERCNPREPEPEYVCEHGPYVRIHGCPGCAAKARVKAATTPLARRSDPVTSHRAAGKVNARTMLAALLRTYTEHPDGLTAEEAAAAAGFSPADGAWKRVSDLITSGHLEDTGTTRRGAAGRDQRVLRLKLKT